MYNYPELFERGREGNKACEQKATRAKGKKVKSLLFNVDSSFSDETGINGSRRCALYSPCLCQCSVLQVFKAMATRIRGKSKQMLGH